jgi:PAS domain S-box-containing protein
MGPQSGRAYMSVISWLLILFALGICLWCLQKQRKQQLTLSLLKKALKEARILIRHFKDGEPTLAPNRGDEIEKLRSYLELLDTLINTIPAPIYFKDKNGVFQGCNKVFAREILGLTRDRIIGQRPQDLRDQIPPDLASTYQRQELVMLDKGGIHSFEAEVLCADGSHREFFFNLAAVMDRKGELNGSVAVLSDLTEKNRAARDRLQKEKLEGVLETAGGVCHELSQPLQALSGYTELLALNLVDPSGSLEYIDKINEQIERIRTITERLQQITCYETVNYSGNTRIIDIYKSSRKSSRQ